MGFGGEFAPITVPSFGGQQFPGMGSSTGGTTKTSGGSSGGGGLSTLGTIAGIAGTALPILNKLGVFGEGGLSGALSGLFGGNTAAAMAAYPQFFSGAETLVGAEGGSFAGPGSITGSGGSSLSDWLGSSTFSLAPSEGLSNLGGLVGANTGTGLLGALGPATAGLGAANFFGNLGQKGVRSEFLGPFGFSTAGQTIQDLQQEFKVIGAAQQDLTRQLQAGQPLDDERLQTAGWGMRAPNGGDLNQYIKALDKAGQLQVVNGQYLIPVQVQAASYDKLGNPVPSGQWFNVTVASNVSGYPGSSAGGRLQDILNPSPEPHEREQFKGNRD